MEPDIILLLWELAQRINSHGGLLPGDSMFERYTYFVKHSEYGKDCSYARKSRDLILKHDYDDILKLFLKVLEEYRKIEGVNFDGQDIK